MPKNSAMGTTQERSSATSVALDLAGELDVVLRRAPWRCSASTRTATKRVLPEMGSLNSPGELVLPPTTTLLILSSRTSVWNWL